MEDMCILSETVGVIFCVLNDDLVNSGCCDCGGLSYVDEGCMCAGVQVALLERLSGMRDPCFVHAAFSSGETVGTTNFLLP